MSCNDLRPREFLCSLTPPGNHSTLCFPCATLVQTACWEALFPSQVIARPAILMEMDCHTATLEEVASVCSSFSMPCSQGMQHANAFGGWFDVTFKVSAEQ